MRGFLLLLRSVPWPSSKTTIECTVTVIRNCNLSRQYRRLMTEAVVQFFFGLMVELLVSILRFSGLLPKLIGAEGNLFLSRPCHVFPFQQIGKSTVPSLGLRRVKDGTVPGRAFRGNRTAQSQSDERREVPIFLRRPLLAPALFPRHLGDCKSAEFTHSLRWDAVSA
jgi:hypothetical protein